MPLSRGIPISRTITSGLVLGGELEEHAAVTGGADDFASWLEQTPEGVQKHRVVVGEKDAGAGSLRYWLLDILDRKSSAAAIGTRTSILVPSPDM